MYSAYIGRRILERYNIRNGTDYEPRTFFDEVFFPLFFDDERYLMWVNNSKFDQKSKQKKAGDPAERREALASFHADAAVLTEPHGHLLLGGYARELDAPTSGQVTAIAVPVATDDVYLSWMGAASGIGVAGGFSILLDHPTILDALLEGWDAYRSWLTMNPSTKPQQIDSWNGWWLMHRLHPDFDTEDPLVDFMPGIKAATLGWTHQLETPPWGQVMFALARVAGGKPLTAYVYTFGNTNKTIGFIRLDLPQVSSLPALYERLFGFSGGLNRSAIEIMWDTEMGFTRACEQGYIGTQAMEPRALRKYMPDHRSPGILPKPPKGEADAITFRIYQTWIIAMLNNEQLLALAGDAARALSEHAGSAKRALATQKRAVENVLSASTRTAFVEGLTSILEEDCTHASLFDTLVTQVVKMPSSDFPLLMTLLRFKYALANC